MSLAVRCPAKINTRLAVLGRRADGFHELDLDFTSIALSDRLELAPHDRFELEVIGAPPSSVPVENNLVVRAAKALQAEVGEPALRGARMRLFKSIPAAAGLGGGSSDAAGALDGLVRLHGLPIERRRLAEIALELGSDVPFFLVGGSQRGTGRGERLQPLPESTDRPLLLLHSFRELSTGRVFESWSRMNGRGPGLLTSRKTDTSFDAGRCPGLPESSCNDLLPAALALLPELEDVLDAVRAACPEGLVGMTGSGPTLFVLLESGASLADVSDRLTRILPEGMQLTPTRTLGAAEYEATRFER